MFGASLPPPEDPIASRPGNRLTAVFAWVVVALICGTFVTLSVLRPRLKGAAGTVTAAPPAAVDVQTRLAGQYAVGVKRLSRAEGEAAVLAMPDTPEAAYEARVATAIVAGELIGREKALQQLRAVGGPDAMAFAAVYEAATPRPATTAASAMTGAEAVPTTSPASLPGLSSLRPRYGWFVDLAESFGQPDDAPQRAAMLAIATRTMTVLFAGFGTLGIVAILGLVLLVTAIVLLATGQMRFAARPPTGPAHVYIEAFAIYLGGFVVVSLALAMVGQTPRWVHIVAQALFVVLGAVWPLLRRVPWPTLRGDWGMHTGRGLVIEALAGVGGYIAGLPIVAAGFAVTLGLITLTKVNAAHPITNDLSAPWLLLAIAAVFAPLTEELLFRGALVSHLRGTWGVVMSSVISGVIFASVHPQGWAAIPVLGSVGAVFALIRQWRDSLVPSITAHALNNGVMVGMLILLTR